MDFCPKNPELLVVAIEGCEYVDQVGQDDVKRLPKIVFEGELRVQVNPDKVIISSVGLVLFHRLHLADIKPYQIHEGDLLVHLCQVVEEHLVLLLLLEGSLKLVVEDDDQEGVAHQGGVHHRVEDYQDPHDELVHAPDGVDLLAEDLHVDVRSVGPEPDH